MKNSKVAILLPMYNVASYLSDCLESVLSQTFSDFEAICIDDGSTDGSGEILERCAARDLRIRVIHKENTGYGHSLNVGLDQARGKYLAIVESDDLAERMMLETLVVAAERDGLDVVKGEFLFLDETGRSTPHQYGQDIPYGSTFRPEEHPRIFSELMLLPSIWSGLYRIDFLRKHQIRFHETPGASFQDVSFVFQVLAKAKRFLLLDTPVYRYRSENTASSVKSVEKPFCIFDEFSFIKAWCEKEVKIELYRTLFSMKYEHYFAHFYRVDALYQYAVLEKIKEELTADCFTPEIFSEVLATQGANWTEFTEACVRMVLENSEAFFRASCEPYWDRIAYRGKMMGPSQALFDLLRFYADEKRPIYVYGAGVYGKAFLKIAKREQLPIHGILVTERTPEQKELSGLPIFSCEDRNDLKEAVVIVAMKKQSQESVLTLLSQKGCPHILSLGRSDVKEAIE